MSLNILKFLTVSTQLAFQASKIINDVYVSKNFGKVMKAADDPVTIVKADYKAQSLIVKGLRYHWPHLKIIGQQDSQYQGDISYDYSKLDRYRFSDKLFSTNNKGQNIETQLKIQNACVWIDPLDGTLSYTNGDLHQVTTLIGLSYNKKSKLGIIGIPYNSIGNKCIFDPKVIVAYQDNQKIYQITQNTVKTLQSRKIPNNFIISTSKRIENSKIELLKQISPKIVHSGGSGCKIAMMLYGKADSMVYLGTRTSKWDICAGEAILKAIGGNVSSIYGEQINYDPSNGDYRNYGGLVCSLSSQSHNKIINKINKLKL